MEQNDSIGGARAPEKKMCALCGEQPAVGGPDALMGEPLCKGPVCRWCYETKVMPARRQADAPEAWGAHGAWALRTPEKKLIIATDAADLAMQMFDEGYFGLVQGMDAVEELIGRLSASAAPGRPLAVEAFGRSYEAPWYGPALLAGPRSVVPVMPRQDAEEGEA